MGASASSLQKDSGSNGQNDALNSSKAGYGDGQTESSDVHNGTNGTARRPSRNPEEDNPSLPLGARPRNRADHGPWIQQWATAVTSQGDAVYCACSSLSVSDPAEADTSVPGASSGRINLLQLRKQAGHKPRKQQNLCTFCSRPLAPSVPSQRAAVKAWIRTNMGWTAGRIARPFRHGKAIVATGARESTLQGHPGATTGGRPGSSRRSSAENDGEDGDEDEYEPSSGSSSAPRQAAETDARLAKQRERDRAAEARARLGRARRLLEKSDKQGSKGATEATAPPSSAVVAAAAAAAKE